MKTLVLGLLGGGVACYAVVFVLILGMIRRVKQYDREIVELTQGDQDAPLDDQEQKHVQGMIRQGVIKPLRWIATLFALGALLQAVGFVIRVLWEA